VVTAATRLIKSNEFVDDIALNSVREEAPESESRSEAQDAGRFLSQPP
jgi:hypothetical protein